MHTVIRDILTQQQITTVFQPIFDIKKQQVYGFEALSRGPQDAGLYNPEKMFEMASHCGYLYELDILCRQLAIRRFIEQDLPGLLFLNVNPLVLSNPKYPQSDSLKMVEQADLNPDRLVIEISEKSPIFSSILFPLALASLRNDGFKVSIDNLGSGYAGLKQWHDLQPDIVKIDRSLIEDCHQNIVKRELLRTIFTLGQATGVKVIAQGIQTAEEFEQLQTLGMRYAQGFFLAEPETTPKQQYPQLNIKTPVVSQPCNLDENQPLDDTIKQLVLSPVTCDISDKAGVIYKMLVSNPKIQCIPVLSNHKPVGLIARHQLMERFSDTYGHALFDSYSVDYFMDTEPMILEQTTTLDQASLFITQQDDEHFSQYFIITNNEKYLGLASSRELLRRITESKIENARYANPLTLLPGNVPIDREVDTLLTKNQPFVLAYVDIDHFKPFNDVYGYAKGDLVIKLLAQIIRSHCQNEDIFIGHIGGDDFIMLFKHGPFKAICEAVVMDFKRQTSQFFDPQHLRDQGYFATNRGGEKTKFPLMSLSIGVISPDSENCASHHEISLMASEAKKEAKKMVGQRVFYCRRSLPNRL